jgi:hypothetical protein
MPAIFTIRARFLQKTIDSYACAINLQEATGQESPERKVMKECAIIDECRFFNDQQPRIHTAKEREVMKRKFCGGGSSQCARFIVAKALGSDEVPENLYPEDLFRVSIILGMP